jgi:hypothetical protein
MSRLRQIAVKRDKLIIEEQSKTQLPQAAAESELFDRELKEAREKFRAFFCVVRKLHDVYDIIKYTHGYHDAHQYRNR